MYTESQIKSEAAIFAKKDGISVYSSTDINSSKYEFPADGGGNYRPWKKGDSIGYISEFWNGTFETVNGSRWIRINVRYWRKRLFDSVRDFKTGYLRVEDDSFVLEQDVNELFEEIKQDEKADIEKVIEQYVTGLSINQRPTDWFKDGDKWVLRFANGSTVGFEEYKKLSNVQRAALSSTGTGLQNNLLNTGTGNGSGNGTGSGFFTTTNILIGVGILAALGIVLYLIFRKNGTAKR